MVEAIEEAQTPKPRCGLPVVEQTEAAVITSAT
jgi:hypothetical protein